LTSHLTKASDLLAFFLTSRPQTNPLLFLLESAIRVNHFKLTSEEGTFMTKADLISAVQKANKILSKRAVEDVVDTTFSTLTKAIKKESRFAYPGFGVFTVRNRKARQGRNPKTGEIISIKPSKTVGFRPAPVLKKSL
jgi:DNA-binding protein HU-beta